MDYTKENPPSARRPQSMVISENGSATIWFLGFLPVVLGLLIGLSAWGAVLIQYKKTQAICRQGNLKVQQALLDGLYQLEKRNPRAQRLRDQLRVAVARVAAASTTGVGLPAATYQLNRVIQRQKVLAAEQQAILHTAEMDARRLLVVTRQKMKSGHMSWSRKYFGQPMLGRLDVNVPDPDLKVRKSPALSLTPDYLPALQFEYVQRLNIKWNWKLQTKRTFLEWLDKPLQLSEFCTTVPKQRGPRWTATIQEDRLSSKLL